MINNLKVQLLKNKKLADPFILEIHYAKRKPSMSYVFGLFDLDELIGVCSYGKSPSHTLAKGIAGEQNMDKVIELNRLVLKYNRKNEASYFIGKTFKLLPKPKIIVSFADLSQNHIGKVYQATNFLYTGLSAKRQDWRMVGSNIHSYTICQKWDADYRKSNPSKFYKIDRPRKHRYLYILANKTDKKQLLKQIKYPIMEYPK